MLCDLNTGSGRISRAARDLRDAWREVSEHWDDRNAVSFEQEFLQPLAPLLSQTLAAVAKFGDVLKEAEQQCQDPDREERSF